MAKKTKKEDSPFVAIPSSLGGIFLVIVIFFMIFASDQLVLLVPLVWGFVVLGVAVAFFAYLARKRK